MAPSTFFLTSLLNSPSRLGFFHTLPQHIKRAEAEAGGGRRRQEAGGGSRRRKAGEGGEGRGEREEGRGERGGIKDKKNNKSY